MTASTQISLDLKPSKLQFSPRLHLVRNSIKGLVAKHSSKENGYAHTSLFKPCTSSLSLSGCDVQWHRHCFIITP